MGAALQGKVNLKPRGSKTDRAKALGQGSCSTVLKQMERSRLGDCNQEQPMILTARRGHGDKAGPRPRQEDKSAGSMTRGQA